MKIVVHRHRVDMFFHRAAASPSFRKGIIAMFKKITIFWHPTLRRILKNMRPMDAWKFLPAQRIHALPTELWKLCVRVPDVSVPLAQWLEGKWFMPHYSERDWFTDSLTTASRIEIHVFPHHGLPTCWQVEIACYRSSQSGKKAKDRVDCRIDLESGVITSYGGGYGE